MFGYFKFRIQRLLRRWRRDVIHTQHSIANYLDLHVWGRWRQLGIIRRFVGVWWAILVVALIGLSVQLSQISRSNTVAGPEPGGTYIEGIVGSIKSINPILPDTGAASDVSRLIFNGLTRVSPERHIEGDLAKSWEVSDDSSVYTFHLHHGVLWQDGRPFTAADVAFTIGLIQNPDTRSPLAASWQGVKLSTPDDYTVVMTLPGTDVSFIGATTLGIVPKHLLASVAPADLRVADFNQHPVGTGPFKLDDVSRSGMELDMVAFERYFDGRPKLNQFDVRLFDSVAEAERSYSQHQLTAIARLPETADTNKLGLVRVWTMDLADEVGVFMKATGTLGDKSLRQALSQAIDRTKVAEASGQLAPNVITLPILPGQIGYTSKYKVPVFDVKAANQTLDGAGWVRGKDGWRSKDGQVLKLRLATANSGGYPAGTKELEKQFKQIGVQLDSKVVDPDELQQTYIRPRNYDLLFFGISIGVDPDVYAYWHSSQASDPGLNLSQYNSHTADITLEAGRQTNDADIRAARYNKFLSVWTGDLPALMVYQPEYLYATKPQVMGIEAHKLVDPSDRFYNVQNWTVSTRPVQRY